MPDETPTSDPPVEAVPDVIASPSEPKRARLDLASEDDKGEGSSASPLQSDQRATEDVAERVHPPTPDATAISLPTVEEQWTACHMTWRGRVYDFKVGSNDLVYDFRRQIEELTEVPPDRQKLVGLIKGNGKLSADLDGSRFGSLGVKQGDVKFTMIGSPENQTFKDQTQLPDAADDFDLLYAVLSGVKQGSKKQAMAPSQDPRNQRKIQEKIEKCPIHMMNEPRPGKGLLVLDLDYTIVDTKPLLAQSLPAAECARPHMHEFLEAMYPHYDIVIWSQTHWMWLETKLAELGIIGAERGYKICFVADRTPMFPIFSIRSDGQQAKHEVKPLAYFWAKFPQWSAKNTIHIDDLSRNFAMNPENGIKIRAYKGAGTPDGQRDRELTKLVPYLQHLATSCDDFSKVDHWASTFDTYGGPQRPRAYHLQDWKKWLHDHIRKPRTRAHDRTPE